MITNTIGIELGSEKVNIYVKNINKTISFKTIVAIDLLENKIIKVGEDANKISEKEPNNIIIKRPIQKGKIVDLELTIQMIKEVLTINKIKNKIINPNVLVAYDIDLNQVEKEVLIEAIRQIGAKNIYMIDSLKLAARGIGMDITKVEGNMIIDIGYQKTKIGILSLNNIVKYKCIDIGSNTFNNDIISYIRNNYKLLIGNKTSEEIKKNLNENNIFIEGKDVITGLPNNINIKSNDIKLSINKSIDIIIESIKEILNEISPELINDISNKGIVVIGGGSNLSYLMEELEKNLNMPVLGVNNPDTCIIDGIKIVLNNNLKHLKKYNISSLIK